MQENMPSQYLESVQKQFAYYKLLGEKTMAQVPDQALFWQYNAESLSIAMLVQHLSGNMLSRWTDWRTTDGEKEWRERDAEFESVLQTRADVAARWEAGWAKFFAAIADMQEDELDNLLYIRNQGHTYMEALNRQLAHYPYHVGQIVFIGKMVADTDWQSLSIPRNQSASFNATKFSQPKGKKHFTDESLGEKP
jgi:Protein of unknown function (DUF1572)